MVNYLVFNKGKKMSFNTIYWDDFLRGCLVNEDEIREVCIGKGNRMR